MRPYSDTPSTFERIGPRQYRVREGICLFREGQPGTGAFLIESGRVELTRKIRGSQTLLAVAGPGELIGEMALIDGEPRSATAITTVETILRAIPARDFCSQLQQLDPMTRMILRKMTRLVRRANDTLIFNPSTGQNDVNQ
ncbi:cyclic nucleotide-binding domain-containing protein [Novispirillum itersonii]|uniref:CRP-like cAMP-binding protein n=1 Tax=Novispirillum itersonii TaxID=189 RepID=A0A7X0DKM7_NOVIT|nr:cyclic nucleotide-binding domain-containing protein [Novispirillum itersonii]MBB6209103.1 CRP-like cAMP-binding protein [Novispirillum itersonii]